MDARRMQHGKQEANIMTESWKTSEYRKRVVQSMMNELIEHCVPDKKFSLSELAESVERFEEKVNVAAKTEDGYLNLVRGKVNSIRELSWKAYEAKNMVINPSGSGTNSNVDVQEHVYQRIQFLKNKYYSEVQPIYQKLCRKIQVGQFSNPRELDLLIQNKSSIECIFSFFQLSKSQITPNMMDPASKTDSYLQDLLKMNPPPKKQLPDVQSTQHGFSPSNSRFSLTNNLVLQGNQAGLLIGGSQCNIMNQSSILGTGSGVQEHMYLTPQEPQTFGACINAPRISATGASGSNTNTNRISPSSLVKDQLSRKSAPGSDEQSPAMKRLIKAVTSISHEALIATAFEIEQVVRLNDLPKMYDEIQFPEFIIPEGKKMRRSFVAMTYDSPSILASTSGGFNQLADAAESSFIFKAKRPQTLEENQNFLTEVKEINNQLFDCEVVIKKENVRSAFGVATKQSEGLAVNILFNAVTINQDLVSHFTFDKKSLIKPLRLLIPSSYPSSSLVILDNLPLNISDNLRDLFERAKAKLRFNLQSLKEPWLIKDIARVWEHCAQEAICDYAHANGDGTFTSLYSGYEVCE